MDKAKAILRTAARYALVAAAELLILIARGAGWVAAETPKLADQARALARRLSC